MKIFKNNAVYVQKIDLVFLYQLGIEIPNSITMKINENELDNRNMHSFLEFNEENEIEFFRNLDWLVNYDEVKDLSEEYILELLNSIKEEKNNKLEEFNEAPDDDFDTNLRLISEYQSLDFKIYNLKEILLLRKSKIHIKLPFEVDNVVNNNGNVLIRLLKRIKDSKNCSC